MDKWDVERLESWLKLARDKGPSAIRLRACNTPDQERQKGEEGWTVVSVLVAPEGAKPVEGRDDYSMLEWRRLEARVYGLETAIFGGQSKCVFEGKLSVRFPPGSIWLKGA